MIRQLDLEKSEPKTRQIKSLRIATLADGSTLKIPVYIIRGAQRHPSLCLLSLIHGNKWFSFEVLRRMLTRIRPQDLNGTLIIVSVANPPAFGSLTRNSLVDMLDLNRCFPGRPDVYPTEKIAHTIRNEIFPHIDYLIDYHNGGWGLAMLHTDVPETEGVSVDVKEESLRIAKTFGAGVIHQWGIYRGTAVAYAAEQGIPSILAAVGGCGFPPRSENLWADIAVRGTANVMRYLGIIDAEPELPDKQALFRESGYIRPTHYGYHLSELEPDVLGKRVAKGSMLGRTICPYTFRELECLKAPWDGIVYALSRTGPVNSVSPYVYCIADIDKIEWI